MPGKSFAEKVTGVDIVLVTCVKSKLDRPAAAKDLYTSPLFRKERAYAEQAGVPWFILSAEHGLVAPDDWLAPYERYLPDTPPAFRSAWAAWVAARLELLVGPVAGKVIEIHASAKYLDVVRPHLESLGAKVIAPLEGLPMGARLAWYGSDCLGRPPVDQDESAFCKTLLNHEAALSPQSFRAKGEVLMDRPGLYSWWVDAAGAADLSLGLGMPIQGGLIYAGHAGATRWPSGKRSRNTLWLRITTMHFGGNHEFSTFRYTLGAILAHAGGTTRIDEGRLTLWMNDHLRVVTVPVDDRDTLGRLERSVLDALDPPFNLQGMQPTPVRERLRALRRSIRDDADQNE